MWCLQPMKSAIIRIFPYVYFVFFLLNKICFFKLCELESIVANESLTMSRMYVAMTYLHSPFLGSLIEQLEQVNKCEQKNLFIFV